MNAQHSVIQSKRDSISQTSESPIYIKLERDMTSLFSYPRAIIVSTYVFGTLLLFATMNMLPFTGNLWIKEWLLTLCGGLLGGLLVLWLHERFIRGRQLLNSPVRSLVLFLLLGILGLYVSAALRMILLVLLSVDITDLASIGLSISLISLMVFLPFVFPSITIGIGFGIGIVNYMLTKTSST